jgi:hypothetical protein
MSNRWSAQQEFACVSLSERRRFRRPTSREYEKDGVKHKVFECRLESILKLDRGDAAGTNLTIQRANYQRGAFHWCPSFS